MLVLETGHRSLLWAFQQGLAFSSISRIGRHNRLPISCSTDTNQMFLPPPPHYIGPTTNSWFFFFFSLRHLPIAPIVMKLGPKKSKTAQLSTSQRSAIIYAHKNGANVTQVQLANDFGCSRPTIYNTLKRYSE